MLADEFREGLLVTAPFDLDIIESLYSVTLQRRFLNPVQELWQVMRGEAAGRTSDRQITLFDSVGFAIEDFSALRFVHDKIRGTEFFQSLDLLADPDEPRDLFGMLMRAG